MKADHRDAEPAVLAPAEAFNTMRGTAELREQCGIRTPPHETGPNSAGVARRIASSCAGWTTPPTNPEFFEAIHADEPTDRQAVIITMWLQEASIEEIVLASAEIEVLADKKTPRRGHHEAELQCRLATVQATILRRLDRAFPPDLALHISLDNYGTHNHEAVRKWLAAHPRFKLHFTPTGSSWLNLVESWFSELTPQRPGRGVFCSVQELVAAIKVHLTHHNADPKPFVGAPPSRRSSARSTSAKPFSRHTTEISRSSAEPANGRIRWVVSPPWDYRPRVDQPPRADAGIGLSGDLTSARIPIHTPSSVQFCAARFVCTASLARTTYRHSSQERGNGSVPHHRL